MTRRSPVDLAAMKVLRDGRPVRLPLITAPDKGYRFDI
ncbi:hypothetical protein A3Q37_02986 [Streptomyces sp. PTY087I2]|nr:hypothetical protein A3Q37_02986 [Streptomyces sp. PTY087I2]